jgi:D-serine deaminase-like pyridoxal phosphate-dependent protein
MTSRRTFLVAAGAFTGSAHAAANVEAKIAKKDFRGITRQDLGTPAMILDEALFEQNLRTMAAHTKSTGINIRPHVKIHKCPDITKKQLGLGAIGACCATMAEAELITNAAMKGVLYTCQPAGVNKIGRAAALAKRSPTFMVVADDPITVDLLNEAAGAAGIRMNVLTDVFVALTRQGIQPGEPALHLAQKIDKSKNLRLAGLMGYSGDAAHTHGFEARRKQSMIDLSGLKESVEMCRKSGLEVPIITGGSTGTYNIDMPVLTELQAGSYIFMDTAYMAIGGKSNDHMYTDFAPALTVLTTVVSATRKNECSIDAGNKAMLRVTDQVKGRPEIQIKNQGAEYGMLHWTDTDKGFKLGELVEIYPTNLDTSVNVYDRLYIARGEQIVDMWPIMGRSGAPQR